jgi:hydroxymethylglutaryl-CoA lyase
MSLFHPTSPADRRVIVTEVGTRDGFQAEREFIPTAAKAAVVQALFDAGVRSIEATSFVSPRAVPQLADAAELLALVRRPPGARIAALVPNARGAERAAAAGVDMMVCFVSASQSHCRANLNKPVEQALADFREFAPIAARFGVPVRGAVAVAFGCPFEGEVPPDALLRVIEVYREHGVRHVTLGDTTGMATPPVVERALRAIADRFPDVEIALHFHNTRGVGLANVMAGLALGVREFESSIGGLGGCPFAPGATGNVCTEDLVYLLHECGYETGIDLERLAEVARQVEALLGRTLPGQVMRAGPRLKLSALESVRPAVG